MIGGGIGMIGGGFGGAKMSEWAVSSFYGHLDYEQKRKVEAFIYQHYGVTR
jgi:hypothetical protein